MGVKFFVEIEYNPDWHNEKEIIERISNGYGTLDIRARLIEPLEQLAIKYAENKNANIPQ